MGSTKVKVEKVDLDNVDLPKEKQAKKVSKAAKAAAQEIADETASNKKEKSRSKAYVNLRSKVDRTITYPIDRALETLAVISRKKHPTVTADINVKDTGINLEMSLPHSTGKTVNVAIVDDNVLQQIEDGNIDFDVLIAKPEMMAKVAKHARVLGPRGLMPNPKNNTVTTEPEKRKKELEAGSLQIKTEKKAPIIHVQIGEITQPAEQLDENLKALTRKIGINKISKVTLSTTMSPGVKVDINSLRPVD